MDNAPPEPTEEPDDPLGLASDESSGGGFWSHEFLGSCLTPTEIAERVIEAAHRLGETDTRAILKAVEGQTPTGRLILKLLGLPTQSKRRGRPRDDERRHLIEETVAGLRFTGLSAAEAHKTAPALLKKRGIVGTGYVKNAIDPRSVRRATQVVIKRWFEPPSIDGAADVN